MSNIVASLQEPGKKKWFIIGGGTVAAYLVYRFYKSRSAGSSTSAAVDSSTVDAGIDPTTGIPYSEEYGTSGGYGGIPSGLSFNAQTGQWQPAASTIVGDVPYSSNSGQAADPSIIDYGSTAAKFLYDQRTATYGQVEPDGTINWLTGVQATVLGANQSNASSIADAGRVDANYQPTKNVLTTPGQNVKATTTAAK